MAATAPRPVGIPLPIAAFGAALLVGATGWVAIPILFLTLPARMLPVVPNEWGAWSVGAFAALVLLLLGGSATAGVALEERILREPAPAPGSRWGLRWWIALALCLTGLAAGVAASLQFTGAVEAGVSSVAGTWIRGDPAGIPVALALGATAGASPTLGLLAARALGRRLRLHAGPRRGDPGGVPGVAMAGQAG